MTCTDSLTGPRSGGRGGGLARIGFAPVFSKAAADIYKDLVHFGLSVNNIHVNLKHANGQTAKDTVVTLTTGQDSVAIEMSVSLNGSTETLGANIELRDGQQVLFAGTQQIQARAGSFPTAPQIPLEYTGPGAAATTLIVDPPSTTIFTNETLALHATGKDKNGQVVPDIVVTWTVKDAARGAVDNSGVFTPTASRGATDIVATLPNKVTGSAHVGVVPHATKLVVISGANQIGTVGKALPQTIVIEAQADDNLGVPNEPVTFEVTGGGGSIDVTTATTDANGRASVKLTLGTTAGTNTIHVASAAVSAIDVSATGNPDNAAKLVMMQQPSASVSSGLILPTQPKSQLQDGFGNAVRQAGVPVTVVLAQGNIGQVLAGTLTVNTDANGVASFTDLKISGPPGTNALVFSSGTFTSVSSADIAVQLGPPAQLTQISGDGQAALAQEVLSTPMRLKVMDAGGNVLQSANVTFTVRSGSNGGVSADGSYPFTPSVTVQSNADGVASVAWQVGTSGSGAQVLTATAGTGSTSFSAYIAERIVLDVQPSLSPQSGVVLPSQPTVHLEDLAGHVVKRSDVFISAYVERVNPMYDVAIFTNGTNYALTDANGVATFADMWIEGDISQHVKLKFFHDIDGIDPDIAVALSNVIALQPGLPTQIIAQNSIERFRLTQSGTQRLAYVTMDGYNAVPNAPVVFDVIQSPNNCTLANASATSDASGVATVDVSTLLNATYISCVVRGIVNTPPPSCPSECYYFQPQEYQKVYVAPSGVFVWTGAGGGEWNTFTSGSWFDGVSPDNASDVFIPAASQWDSPPGLTTYSPTVKSLTLESGSLMYLDFLFNGTGNTITVTSDLAADGVIEGPGTVVLRSTAGKLRAPVGVFALLRIDANANYDVFNATYVDSLEVQGNLTLNNDLVGLQAGGEMRTLGAGTFNQIKGSLYVGGDLKLMGGKSVQSGGSMQVYAGSMLITRTGGFDQSAGTIRVAGDFKFDMGQTSTLTGGLISLDGNFFYNGNGDNFVLHASAPHTLQMTAATDVLGRPVEIRANASGGLTLGKLAIMTSGIPGAVFKSPDISMLYSIQDVSVASGASLRLDSLFTLTAGGNSGQGVHVDANGFFTNTGIINVSGTVVPIGCSPMRQAVLNNESCVTQ